MAVRDVPRATKVLTARKQAGVMKQMNHKIASCIAVVALIAGCQSILCDQATLLSKEICPYRPGKEPSGRMTYHYYISREGKEIRDGQWQLHALRGDVLLEEGRYSHGKRDGVEKHYRNDGKLSCIKTFKRGVLDGSVEYYGEGLLSDSIFRKTFSNGILNGEYVLRDEAGKEKCRGIYRNGRPWEGTFDIAQSVERLPVIRFSKGKPLESLSELSAQDVKQVLKTVMPEIEFRSAPIYDCLASLSIQAKEHSSHKRALIFFVSLPSEETPGVTFKARNISVGTTLKLLSEMCGASVSIDDSGMIHVYSAKVGPGNIDFAQFSSVVACDKSGDPAAAPDDEPRVPEPEDVPESVGTIE